MSGGVFVFKSDGSLVEMEVAPFDSEKVFQDLLERFPRLLSGDQINPSSPRKWLLISREQSIPSEDSGPGRWSVDHLFLDQDGVPTLVEVKRQSDSRIRREVVGQMLDYAANAVVYWPGEEIRSRFQATCENQDKNASDVLADLIGDEADEDEFWRSVDVNLKAGRIRMLFVADNIPSELQRIVEFLNEQMRPAEVLAVEIRRFAGEGLRTLVPRVIGQTSEAQQRKGVSGRAQREWDEETFFADVQQRRGNDTVVLLQKILDWMKNNSDKIVFGKGSQYGSISSDLRHQGRVFRLIRLWTDGTLEFRFSALTEPPFDDLALRVDLLQRINKISEVDFPDDDVNRSPTRQVSRYFGGSRLDDLLRTLDWAVNEIRTS
jgi:hypothetical protein